MILSGPITVSTTPQDVFEIGGATTDVTPDFHINLQNNDTTNTVYITGTTGSDAPDPTYIEPYVYQILPGQERSFDVASGDHLWIATGSGTGQDAVAAYIILTK
jgi:hypothetical protein